jgi:hypothetical protein
MPNPLDPLFPPGDKTRTEAKSFEELRNEYRERNRQRIRRLLRRDDLAMRDKDGRELSRISTGFSTTQPAGQDHRRLDEFLATGEAVPTPGNEFKTLPVPQAKLDDLVGNVEGVLHSEQVRHLGNPSGDPSREGPPLASMDEQAVLDWTRKNVARECGAGELNPHLKGRENAPQDTRLRKIRIPHVPTSTGPSSGPSSGTFTGAECQGEVPTWNQSPNWPAGAGDESPVQVESKDGGIIWNEVRAASAQETTAFKEFWDAYERRGTPAPPGSPGSLPPGSTLSIPNEVAYRYNSKIWFANRGPFNPFRPGNNPGLRSSGLRGRVATNTPDSFLAPANWRSVLAKAVRRTVHAGWNWCCKAVTGFRSRF